MVTEARMSDTNNTTEHDDSTNADDVVDTSKEAIDREAAELWDDRYGWTYEWSSGRSPCDDCALYERRGEPCEACGGTGFHAGEEPLHSYGETCGISADVIADACNNVADVVAHGRVALERHAAGNPQNDYVPPEAVALLAELAELGPLVARASVLAQKISDLAWKHEDGRDPRILAREERTARIHRGHGIEVRGDQRVLVVDRFADLDSLVDAVKASAPVHLIEMTAGVYGEYIAKWDALVESGVDALQAYHAKLHTAAAYAVEFRNLGKFAAGYCATATDVDEHHEAPTVHFDGKVTR